MEHILVYIIFTGVKFSFSNKDFPFVFKWQVNKMFFLWIVGHALGNMTYDKLFLP